MLTDLYTNESVINYVLQREERARIMDDLLTFTKRRRRVRSIEEMAARERQRRYVMIEKLNGETVELHDLNLAHGRYTFLDVYVTARLALGLRARGDSRSLALVFRSSVRSTCSFQAGEIIPATRRLCDLRGCILQAVVHD